MSVLSNRLLCVCLVLLSLSGCITTTNQDLAEGNRGKLAAVYIDPKVTKHEEKLYWFGPAMQNAMLFGIVGAVIGAEATKDTATQIQTVVDNNGVSIDRIVTEELAAAIRDSSKLPLTDSAEAATATIQIEVKRYGLSIPNGFHQGQVVPVLFLQCQMLDRSGAVIWQGGDRMLPISNPIEPMPIDSIKDPKAIENQWRLAARALSRTIVAGLPQGSAPAGVPTPMVAVNPPVPILDAPAVAPPLPPVSVAVTAPPPPASPEPQAMPAVYTPPPAAVPLPDSAPVPAAAPVEAVAPPVASPPPAAMALTSAQPAPAPTPAPVAPVQVAAVVPSTEAVPTSPLLQSTPDAMDEPAPAASGWTVCVASSKDDTTADGVSDRLAASGVLAQIVPVEVKGELWYRVTTGSFADSAAASRYAHSQLASIGYTKAWACPLQ